VSFPLPRSRDLWPDRWGPRPKRSPSPAESRSSSSRRHFTSRLAGWWMAARTFFWWKRARTRGTSRRRCWLSRGWDETGAKKFPRSEEHTSELQSRLHLVCRLLLEKKKKKQ